MAQTILLLSLAAGFILFLLYTAIRANNISKMSLLLITFTCLTAMTFIFYDAGANKIKADIVRLIKNTGPKDSDEVYTILFNKPTENCATVINFKDQVIPKIDCCIWMEMKLCPLELKRIISLKNYETTQLFTTDSLRFLKVFSDRPIWWHPQLLGDSITKCAIKFNIDKEQTLFFGTDSAHVYLCDKAL